MSLELKNISLAVEGHPHIYQSNLKLEKATMNVLLGPTLSGKTTLMRIMAGLEKPSSGQIIWNGKDITNCRLQDRDLAMVYQQFINYPTLSVYENIASPLRVMNKNKHEIEIAVKKAAEILKISPYLDRKPIELSGGQQQRCALARALVKGAGLVLLDEPLANLDYKLREELREEIPKIFERSGAIFVYATTEPEEALLLGGNTAALFEGRIRQFGKTSQVYRNPKDIITADVFSNPPMNFLKFRKKYKKLTFEGGISHIETDHLSNLSDGDYIAGFRANHLDLTRKRAAQIKFSVRVNQTEITGSETFIHMDYTGEKWIGLVKGVHNLDHAANIPIYLDPAHIYIFAEEGNLELSAFYATKVK